MARRITRTRLARSCGWSLTLYTLLALHLYSTFTEAFVRSPSRLVVNPHAGQPLSPAAPSRVSEMPTARTAALRAATAAPASVEGEQPYDIAVVGLGVGGHAACLHAKALGLRVVAVSGGDPGGTCVNRGCIPSKALLAAARRVRMLQHRKLLQEMGIDIAEGAVKLNPRMAGKYALGIAARVRFKGTGDL